MSSTTRSFPNKTASCPVNTRLCSNSINSFRSNSNNPKVSIPYSNIDKSIEHKVVTVQKISFGSRSQSKNTETLRNELTSSRPTNKIVRNDNVSNEMVTQRTESCQINIRNDLNFNTSMSSGHKSNDSYSVDIQSRSNRSSNFTIEMIETSEQINNSDSNNNSNIISIPLPSLTSIQHSTTSQSTSQSTSHISKHQQPMTSFNMSAPHKATSTSIIALASNKSNNVSNGLINGLVESPNRVLHILAKKSSVPVKPPSCTKTTKQKQTLNIDSRPKISYDQATGIISGEYDNDLNILEIDRLVLERISYNGETNLKSLIENLENEKLSIKRPQNIISRKYSIQKIKNIALDIKNIKNSTHGYEYSRESKHLLEEYQRIGIKPDVVFFSRKEIKKTNHQMDPDQEERIMIIERYLEIARKYTTINITKNIFNHCSVCHEDISLSTVNADGLLVCNICGTESVYLCKTISDDNDNNSTNRDRQTSDYEDKENFHKALVRYQGKQSNKLPSDLFEQLDEYFSSRGFPTGEEIKQEPLSNDSGTSIKIRGRSNKNLLLKALKVIGMPELYGDINLICKLYWKWELPDLVNLEETLLNDYDLTQEIFERNKGDRKSCLNNQYRLWRHLSQRGHMCRSRDFKMVKTPEIIRYHEQMWALFCRELIWKDSKSMS